VDDGKELLTVTVPERTTSVAFAADGSLATAGLDGTIKIWETEKGKELKSLKSDEGVWSLTFTPDGKRLASAGWDQVINFWDVDAGKVASKIVAHDRSVLSIAFSPNGAKIASGGIDQAIRVWDLGAKK